MNNEIKQYIKIGEFKKAYEATKLWETNKIYSLLIDIASDSETLVIYGFICYLLSFKETSLLHAIASVILSYTLTTIEGAFQTAFFHAKQALILEPDDVEYMDLLLSFHEIPDKLLEKKEAIELAKKILKIEPNNIRAKDVLRRYDIDSH